MLEELRIEALGVIDESVLELGPGFTVITGETGAGKTMLVTALGLLLGGRADSSSVRTGAKNARVEGVLHVDGLTEPPAIVEAAGGTVEDGRLVVARQVSAEGRSRAFAGGAGVPASVLTRLGEELVAVHGQSDQHRLVRTAEQRDALDRFAGPAALEPRAAFGVLFHRLREVDVALAEVLTSARERAREADLLRFGLQEIEALDPQPGEDQELAAEETRLGYADALRVAAEQARAALSADDGTDALGLVGAARRELEGVRDHDEQASGLADRLAEVSYLLSDLAADVASYAAGLEADPARLAAVSQRRASLTALTRKYGATADEVLAWAQQAAQRLFGLDNTDEEILRLRRERAEVVTELDRVGDQLHQARCTAAEQLAERVTEELAELAMPQARMHMIVTRTPGEPATGTDDPAPAWRGSATGTDEVDFQLAANPGSEPRALGRSASGGELSRVMLALEVVMAGNGAVPTFVFDEVDAGVGGKAAVEVGRRLKMLAGSAQVIVVTHLPQVAAFADQHVVVSKSADGQVTRSGLVTLDEAGREQELSRMLAGMEDSSTARAHARELLATARGRVKETGRGRRRAT